MATFYWMTAVMLFLFLSGLVDGNDPVRNR
jgi:hypothetical protein